MLDGFIAPVFLRVPTLAGVTSIYPKLGITECYLIAVMIALFHRPSLLFPLIGIVFVGVD